MGTSDSYSVTVLLDVNNAQDIDDRAEARTYIVSDRRSGRAIIVDAVLENVERDCKVIRDLGLTLLFAVETHIHADHITGATLLKARTGAQIVYGGAQRVWSMVPIGFSSREKRCPSATHASTGSPRRGIPIAAAATLYLAPYSQAIRCSLVVMAGPTCKAAQQRSCSIPYTASFLLFQTTPSYIPVMTTTAGCHRRSVRKSNGTKG